MVRFEIIPENEKKKIISMLKDTYGISIIDGSFVRIGKDKIRLFSSRISGEDLLNLGKCINIELIGIYLCKLEKDGIRLSHDACTIFRNQITKNILELDDKQSSEWLKGFDVLINNESRKFIKGFYVLSNNSQIIGCGKLGDDQRIRNFVPKSRRLK